MFLRKFKKELSLINNYFNTRRRMASQVHDDGSREFKVPVPWGHVAGKEWGPPNGQKVLAVHGWQDNAGSFDPLIPLLDSSLNIYAIDLPGHGRSSPMPAGISDTFGDKLSVIHRVVRHFALSNLIYMGHSYGSALGYLYCAAFPEIVSKYIALEALRPFVRPLEYSLKRNRFAIESLIELDSKLNSPPPSYTSDEAVQKLVEGTSHSLTLDSARILAIRGLAQSSTGGYFFSRDLKVKLPAITLGVTSDNLLKYASEIRCPVLFLSAKDRGRVNIPWALFEEDMEILKNRSAPFIHEKVDGTHYLHLNNPERVAPTINKFIALQSSL